MKFKWSLFAAILSMLLVLTACNSNEVNPEESNTPETETPTNESEELVGEEVDETETFEEEKPVEEEVPQTEEPTDEGTKDDPTVDPNAQVMKSDNQDYQILLLSNYTLDGEEPGKDIVYPAEDTTNYMRIETQDVEDGVYDYLLENMITFLNATSENANVAEQTDTSKFPQGDSLKDIKVYSTVANETPVTGIIFERDGLLVRLTIFDSPNSDYYNDFIRMAESISK